MASDKWEDCYTLMRYRRSQGVEWATWSIRGKEALRWDITRVYNYENIFSVIRDTHGKWFVNKCTEESEEEVRVGPYESFKAAMVAATTMIALKQYPWEVK